MSFGFERVFPNIPMPNNQDFRVRKVEGLRDALRTAFGVKKIVRVAYERQFEQNTNMLPPGTVREHIANEDETGSVIMQGLKMWSRMRKGAEYWVAPDPAAPRELLSLVKLTKEAGKVVLSDVMSREERKGYGTATLHAALLTHSHKAEMNLHGFVGSPVNEWYERMGFERLNSGEPYPAFGERLYTREYDGVTVGDVQHYLVTHHAEELKGSIISSNG